MRILRSFKAKEVVTFTLLALLTCLYVSFGKNVVLSSVSEVLRVSSLTGEVLQIDKNGKEIALQSGDVIEKGYRIMTAKDASVTVQVGLKGFFSLDSDSVLQIDDVRLSQNDRFVALYLQSGRVWINNLYNNVAYNIFTNKSLILPGSGTALISYDGLNLFAYNARRDLYVGFLSDVYVHSSENLSFLNSLYIPEGSRLTVKEIKIGPKIYGLYPSKLLKEFPYELVDSDSLMEDDFVRNQVSFGTSFQANLMKDYLNSLQSPILPESIVGAYREYLELPGYNLILSENVANFKRISFLRHVFDEAQFYDFRKKQVAADLSYGIWGRALRDLSHDVTAYLSSELQDIAVVENNELEEGKDLLYTSFYNQLLKAPKIDELLDYHISRLMDVYPLFKSDDSAQGLEAFSHAMDEVADTFTYVKGTLNEQDFAKCYVLRESIMNLFVSFLDMYSNDSFARLDNFDHLMVKAAPDKLTQEELRQAILIDRVKILKKIIGGVKDKKMGPDHASELGLLVLASSSDFSAQALYRLAIYDVLEGEFNTVQNTLEYLSSAEYKLLRGTFEDGFNEFLRKKVDWEDLKKYIAETKNTKQKVKRVNVSALSGDVYKIFTEHDMYPESVTSLGDSGNRLFKVSGVKSRDLVFEAIYDISSQLAYDIAVEGKTITKGVQIDKLKDMLSTFSVLGDSAFSTSTPIADEQASNEGEKSSAEALATGLAIKELNAAQFFVKKDQIKVIDLETNTFFVQDIGLADSPYIYSFEYDNVSDVISHVSVVDEQGSEILYRSGPFQRTSFKESITEEIKSKTVEVEIVQPKVKVPRKR